MSRETKPSFWSVDKGQVLPLVTRLLPQTPIRPEGQDLMGFIAPRSRYAPPLGPSLTSLSLVTQASPCVSPDPKP